MSSTLECSGAYTGYVVLPTSIVTFGIGRGFSVANRGHCVVGVSIRVGAEAVLDAAGGALLVVSKVSRLARNDLSEKYAPALSAITTAMRNIYFLSDIKKSLPNAEIFRSCVVCDAFLLGITS